MSKECNFCSPYMHCEAPCNKFHYQHFSDGFKVVVFDNIENCEKRKEVKK